ncbi:MAG: serine hydrolase [Sphingomicrobium sp.]
MKLRRAWIAFAALALLPLAPVAALAPSPEAGLSERLTAIGTVPVGRVGIATVDLTTGRETQFNAADPFPMASTVKVAVAVMYLAEVDAGRRSLDKMIALNEALRSGSDGIGQDLPHPGVSLSAANLIHLMLTLSDNTATDVLINELGGTGKVEAWLVAHSVVGIRIDRNIARLVLDNLGLPMMTGKTAAQTLWASDPLPEAARAVAVTAFNRDPRDTATPAGMAHFLARIERGEFLKPSSQKFLIDTMIKCKTGPDRIKGLLPEGTIVAHKTGTLAGLSDDVGIVTLPNGHKFVIAVFTMGIAEGPARARIIAEAARTTFDFYATR